VTVAGRPFLVVSGLRAATRVARDPPGGSARGAERGGIDPGGSGRVARDAELLHELAERAPLLVREPRGRRDVVVGLLEQVRDIAAFEVRDRMRLRALEIRRRDAWRDGAGLRRGSVEYV